MSQFVELVAPISELLAAAGADTAIKAITPCAVGGNNRIYRVDTRDGVFAAKQYFRHDSDSRDRLATEYAFLTYAELAAPGTTPRPYACNPDQGLGLYEFVDGRPFRPGEIGAAEVDAAISFFRALNVPSLRATTQFRDASEACFSIADHLALVAERIDRLLDLEPRSEVDRRALGLFRRLHAFWGELSGKIHADPGCAGPDLYTPLGSEMRCISPSDFGFNNALITTSGTICFLDFEYAGRDDPAKTAGDFFAQLAVPVPSGFFGRFVSEIMRDFPDAPSLSWRAALLRPVYRIKWCCIALNVFLPVHLARRRFANPSLDEMGIKQTQLAKAEQIFRSIQTKSHGLY